MRGHDHLQRLVPQGAQLEHLEHQPIQRDQ
jgi:hypothetical protein